MRSNIDIDLFVKDPGLLIELCQKIIDRLDNKTDDPKTIVKEAQLREIAKAVEKLEKLSVPVPDTLRAEKTRLAAELNTKTEEKQILLYLADELEEIINDLNARLGRSIKNKSEEKKPRVKRSHSPKTDNNILRENIIKALKALGGRAKVAKVIEKMGHQLEGKLLPGDMEWRESTGEYAWQNNAKWERYSMTQDGTLRSDSPRGYWELGERQK